jgi:hypothetical protein
MIVISKFLTGLVICIFMQSSIAMEHELVSASQDDAIVHDFLYDHAKFQAIWGTRDNNATTYSKLPKEVAQIIIKNALTPVLPMLKECPTLLKTVRKVSKTLFQKPIRYETRVAWNYHAVNLNDETITPAPFEAHPKSNLALSALHDCSIKIWNMTTQTCVQTLVGHTQPVRYAQFDPQGNRIATSSDDATVKLWNALTGECMHTLHKAWFKCPHVRFTCDGSRLVIADSNVFVLWDVVTGIELYSTIGHHIFRNFTFNNEETHLMDLHQEQDGSLHASLWDIRARGGKVKQIETAYCDDIGVSDNAFLVKGSRKHVSIWNVGSYFDAVKFLDNLTLEQALLLNCLAHTMLINKILLKNQWFIERTSWKKKWREFDFNMFPHLQPYFNSLPQEIQHGLSEYVNLHDDDNSWCTIV